MQYGPKTQEMRRNIELMTELLKHHGTFRNFVAIMANFKCGVPVAAAAYEPRFIYKTEGGLVVNKQDVVLSMDSVYDDYRHANHSTEEELATVDALEDIAASILDLKLPDGLNRICQTFLSSNKFGMTEQQDILEKIKGRQNPFDGDPWRFFFGEAYNKHVSKANADARAAGKAETYF